MQEGLLPVSQKLGSRLLKQASERQISSFRVSVGGQLFGIPENLICLVCQVFSLVTLSLICLVPHELAPGRCLL